MRLQEPINYALESAVELAKLGGGFFFLERLFDIGTKLVQGYEPSVKDYAAAISLLAVYELAQITLTKGIQQEQTQAEIDRELRERKVVTHDSLGTICTLEEREEAQYRTAIAARIDRRKNEIRRLEARVAALERAPVEENISYTPDHRPFATYMCADAGITDVEIHEFALLQVDTGMAKDQRQMHIFNNLARYGRSEDEIAKYMTEHFTQCDSCNNVYVEGRKAGSVMPLVRQLVRGQIT